LGAEPIAATKVRVAMVIPSFQDGGLCRCALDIVIEPDLHTPAFQNMVAELGQILG